MPTDQGWIKLYRQIEDWEFYFDEPFTYAQAWIDLLLLANHKEKTICVRGNLIKIQRGEIGWSEANLARRWQWSRDKVRRFFTMLKTRQQITQEKSRILGVKKILNYEKYQSDNTTDQTTEKHQTRQQKNTNKNDKNEKNEKNIFASSSDADTGVVNSVLEVFQMKLNPGINYGNTTQRKAVQWLLENLGKEKVLRTIEYAAKIRGEPFSPIITTPIQLKEKLGQLSAYYEKSLTPRQGAIKSI